MVPRGQTVCSEHMLAEWEPQAWGPCGEYTNCLTHKGESCANTSRKLTTALGRLRAIKEDAYVEGRLVWGCE